MSATQHDATNDSANVRNDRRVSTARANFNKLMDGNYALRTTVDRFTSLYAASVNEGENDRQYRQGLSSGWVAMLTGHGFTDEDARHLWTQIIVNN